MSDQPTYEELVNTNRRLANIIIRNNRGTEDLVRAEVKKAKREAWDEGAMASESLSCENPPCGVCEHCGTPLDNPYRREP